jgi:hypothetical protein
MKTPTSDVGDGFLPIGGREGLKPIVLEGAAQSLTDHEVLIDYQNVSFLSHEEILP